MRGPGAAWYKWLGDLSSTRVQVTLIVLSVWAGLGYMAILIAWRGVQLIRTAQDAAMLLAAIKDIFVAISLFSVATLGAWFGGKWLQQNVNNRHPEVEK